MAMSTPEPASRPTGEPLALIRATAADLPPAVADALANPPDGRRITVRAAGITFSALDWPAGAGALAPPAGTTAGHTAEHTAARPVTNGSNPLLLIHGVTSSARTWWRIGPALAAGGWHVVAPDLPGHGRTNAWHGRHRFAETAEEVAAFARAAGLTGAGDDALAVIGHSWGAMVAAHLPSVGLVPGRIVLLDPPVMTPDQFRAMAADPVERRYETLAEALAAIGAAYPAWHPDDILAKAEGLTEVDEAAARAILTGNEWDAGLGALAHPAAAGVPIRVVRGEPGQGGLLPDAWLPEVTRRIGEDHLLTIAGAPHSPQRTHPEATMLALLLALGAGRPRSAAR